MRFKKGILIVFMGLLIFTGCNNSNSDVSNKKAQEEISVIGAYIVDYDDSNYLGGTNQANFLVVFNISPKKDILLYGSNDTNIKDQSFHMLVEKEKIIGKFYQYQDYDVYNEPKKSILANESAKIAYVFRPEKYLYKDNDTFIIDYDIGKKEGEFSYNIKGSIEVNKKDVKDVELFEDIVKDIYQDDSIKVLMKLSLRMKINNILDYLETYKKLGSNFKVYDCNTRDNFTENAKKMLDFFSEEGENKISISNHTYINQGGDHKLYNLPRLDYNVLENEFPGIKEHLEILSKLTNDYANDLLNVPKDKCSTYLVRNFDEMEKEANYIKKILDNQYY